jgi:DNA-binding NarL/FixJ family response regulator
MTVKNRSVAPHQKRLLLVDNHPLFRQGLAQLVNLQQDLAVCGETDNSQSALVLADELRPDLVATDLNLRKSLGMELIKDLKIQHPSIPVLVITIHDESLYTERALRAGAKGYIMKDKPGDEILGAIRRVLTGRIYLSDGMGTKLLAPLVNGCADLSSSPIDRLSDRELEVFQLLGKAYETREIAEKLRVSIKTVESYREHIKLKLNLENSTQLIHRAVVWAQNSGVV